MRLWINIALFLTPFVVFFAYAYWANPRRRAKGDDPLRTPWFYLLVLALVLAIGGFFVLRATIDPPEGCYIPARVVEGKLEPARYEPCDGSRPGHIPAPTQP